MKDNDLYFSHDASAMDDQKMINLYNRWKWKGTGIYWHIIELLRKADNYELVRDYLNLSKKFKISEKILKSIIEDFELFEIKGAIFYSNSLKRRMVKVKEKSEKARVSARIRWEKELQKKYGLSSIGDLMRSAG